MNRKTIALPGLPDIDITPILPIIDHQLFQRMRYRHQLGTSFFVFPAANHTRYEHSLGTFALTGERTRLWLNDGIITEEQAVNLKLFGLLHDIGHGPFSHATEPLCRKSHEAYGAFLLSRMGKAIEKCGGSIDQLRCFFLRTDPLHCCVTHRPLGTDKIDYLTRDARWTTESVGLRRGDLLNHVSYLAGQLSVDVKIMAEAIKAQSDYIYMHDRVYLRKACVIIQRFLQQIVARLLAAQEITPGQLACMTDFELMAALVNTRQSEIAALFQRLVERNLPKTAIQLMPAGVMTHDRLDSKAIKVYEMSEERLQRFEHFCHPEAANAAEAAIASMLGIPPEAILVVPIATPERFVPEDILLNDGSLPRGLLREARPAHYTSLVEIARSYATVRICVFKEYRRSVAFSDLTSRIIKLLEDSMP